MTQSFSAFIVDQKVPANPRGEAGKMQNAVRARHPTLHTYSPDARDNLEFLQWMKRFWDQNYGGQGYDAVARRKGVALEAPATVAPITTSRSTTNPGLAATAGRAGGRTPVSGFRSGSAQPNEAVQALQAQLKEMSTHLEGLEKERDFYFEKVRLRRHSFHIVSNYHFSYEISRSSSSNRWRP